MVEDYFGEVLGNGLDKVFNCDSMDVCISWTIVQTAIGNKV